MLTLVKYFAVTLMVLMLNACVTLPTGPSVLVLPGAGKSFDQFRYDDNYCKQYAQAQLGGKSPQDTYLSSGVGSAAVGAGLGAAVGAALGGGRGAAIGAGSGLAVGGLAGTDASRISGYEAQKYYDIRYIQCMYALGHRVPVSGRISDESLTGTPQIQSTPPPPR